MQASVAHPGRVAESAVPLQELPDDHPGEGPAFGRAALRPSGADAAASIEAAQTNSSRSGKDAGSTDPSRCKCSSALGRARMKLLAGCMISDCRFQIGNWPSRRRLLPFARTAQRIDTLLCCEFAVPSAVQAVDSQPICQPGKKPQPREDRQPRHQQGAEKHA